MSEQSHHSQEGKQNFKTCDWSLSSIQMHFQFEFMIRQHRAHESRPHIAALLNYSRLGSKHASIVASAEYLAISQVSPRILGAG